MTHTETDKWDLTHIETYFKNNPPPDEAIPLKQGETILNPKKFVASHLAFCKSNNGNPTFEPYLNRLIGLMDIMKGKSNTSS